jgi:DNA-binding NtrC family response regulator
MKPSESLELERRMKKRVLLIDSEPMVRERLCKKLERQNYDVRWAAHAQDALNNVDLCRTDLLLIDLDVPPAESLGILSRIAGVNPVLPVVGLTERTDLPAAALGSGVSALVEKPIDAGGLFRLMEDLLTHEPKATPELRRVRCGSVSPQGNRGRRPTEPHVCPAPYSGWGIND